MSNEIDHRINARHLTIATGIISAVFGACCWLTVAYVDNLTKAQDKLEQRVQRIEDKMDSKFDKLEEVTRVVVKHNEQINSAVKDIERLERNQEIKP
jgi:enoyl-[acyl-carrier-protein] reductase (NADH)